MAALLKDDWQVHIMSRWLMFEMNQGRKQYSVLPSIFPMRTGLTEQLDKWSILDELDELEEEWAMHEYVSH